MYYKFVQNRFSFLYSYNGGNHHERMDNKLYLPHVWTEADPTMFKLGFGLAVFSSLETAKNYAIPRNCLELWKCETFTPENWKPSDFMKVWAFEDLPSLKYCLQHDRKELTGWPVGTVLVQKVKLIERIYENDLP